MKISKFRLPNITFRFLMSVVAAFGWASVSAQTVDAAYASAYSVHVVGTVAGLPTNYGGLVFKDGDPDTILIGGGANGSAGRFHAVPVIRGAGNHITGFGTPTALGFGGNNDGGVGYSPSGVLMYSKYNNNQIGQVKPGSNVDNKVSNLGALNVAVSPGALAFVPTGRTGAGKLKIISYSGGQFYDVAYADDRNGTYNLTSAVHVTTLPGSPEGVIYAPSGSPLFNAGTLLVTEYGAGKVSAYDTDANGDPLLASRKDFISGLTGGEGAAIDPRTGDFLFSTFGSSNRVIRIEGFTPPPPIASVAIASSTNPSTPGQSLTFTATVTGVAPLTGTVEFQDGSLAIPGCAAVDVSAGTAICSTSSLQAGAHAINAIYSGNSANSGNHAGLSQIVNTPPTAGPQTLSTFQDLALNSVLVASDAETNSLTFTVVTQPTHGVISGLNASTGAFTYTPNAGYIGTDTFQYKANDGFSDSNVATLGITVTALNHPPVAGFGKALDFDGTNEFVEVPYAAELNPDVFTVEGWVDTRQSSNYSAPFSSRDASTNGATKGWNVYNTSAGVWEVWLGNSTSSWVILHGASVQPNRWVHIALTYSAGTAKFYINGILQQSHTGVALTKNPGKPFRIGASDNLFGSSNRAAWFFNGYVDEVRLWSTERSADEIKDTMYRYIQNPAATPGLVAYWDFNKDSGSSLPDLAGGRNGTLRNMEDADWTNSTSPSLMTVEDTPVSAYLKASDQDNDALTFSIVTQPTKGTIALDAATGHITYTPNANANGDDSFTFKVNDGQVDSNVATMNIIITPVNDAPVGTPDHRTVAEDGVLNSPTVLDNDHDVEGDALSAVVVTNPTHGVLSFNANGTFTYTPVANYNGPDSFTYAPRDGASNGAPVMVSITVTAVNDPPIAHNDPYSIAEDGVLAINAPGVLGNDTDQEANSLTAVLKTSPTNGVLALNADGSFLYTPNANFNGTDSFSYVANDGLGDSNIATVTITVNAQNDPPVAAPDSYTLMEDTVLQVSAKKGLLANDTDVDGDVLHVQSHFDASIIAPQHGVLKALNGDGSFIYQPNPNYNGTDSFTYVVSDGKAASAAATVNLTIRSKNDPPVANADSYTVASNAVLKVTEKKGILHNDTDVDGDVLRPIVVTPPVLGGLNMKQDGSFTYLPNPAPCSADRTDSFTYKANDGAADSNVATVTINIHCTNRAPVGNPDVYAMQQGSQLAIPAPGVMINDSDPDGNQITAVLLSQPTKGALAFNPDGSLSYRAAIAGSDSFTYKVTDGALESAPITVNITVTATNQLPLAAGDSYSTTKNATLNVAAPGVLANDSDPDGNPLTSVAITQPSHGSVHMDLDGSFTYTPAANYVGLDSFQYTVNDGTGVSLPATVLIDVRSANFPPVASNDSYSTPHNVALTVAAPGLLGNDSDPDGNQPLHLVIASQPTRGTLALGVGGGFTYTPAGGVCVKDSTDSFTYYANDSVANSNLATVSIFLNCVNRAPVGVSDSYTVAQGAQLAIPAPGVMINDNDPDGNPITAMLLSQPTKGALGFNPNGGFFYNAVVAGADSFTYKVTDGAMESAPITVNITVTAVNRAPLAGNDSYQTTKNAVLNVPAPGVLGNDIDLDGNALSLASVMQQPANGTLTTQPDGSFVYTPNSNYVGLDSFKYTASDGAAISNVATVIIDVGSANFPPVANNDSYSTPHNVTLKVPAPGLLGNDHDPDGNQPLLVVLASQPTKGTLTLSAGGGFNYTPTASVCNADSTDSFTYYANDSVVNSNLATVTIAIHCTNRAPLGNDDSYTIAQGAQLAIPAPGVMINDSDPDGNPITAVLVSQPTKGALAFNPDGSFAYQGVVAGTDSFTYKITDGALESAAITVNITVTATNTAPLAANDSYRTTKNATLKVAAPGVLSNDIDADGNTLRLASVMQQPANGTLTTQPDGSFVYTPNSNYVGLDSFKYAVTDGAAISNTATVIIDVGSANFAPVANNDSYSTPHNVTLKVPAPGLLGNDSDPDGNQPLLVVLASQPTKGTLTLTAGGGFTYTPTGGVCSKDSSDSFTYYANDSVVNSNLATVSIAIHCTNRAPVAVDDAYSVAEGAVLKVTVKKGVLRNDSDADGNLLQMQMVSSPTHGSLSAAQDGSFTYRPNAGFSGIDGFTYKANDGAADSNVATVTITVNHTNRAPVGTDDSYSVQQGVPLSVATPGVLANDSDPDGDQIAAALLSQPTKGTLSFNPDGSFVYTASSAGADSFTYQVSDGALQSAAITVNLTVTAAATFKVGGTVSGLTTNVALTLSNNGTDLVTQPGNGTFVFPQQLASGAAYSVAVQTQPAGHTCTVSSGQGTVASSDVSNVAVTCVANTGPAFSGTLPGGGGTATGQISGGGGTCTLTRATFQTASSVNNALPSGYTFPVGLLDLATTGCATSSSLTVTITYPSALPAGAVLWKFGPTPGNTSPHWYQHPFNLSADGKTLSYGLTDGQTGDDDLAANGEIVDPAGPGVPPPQTQVAPIPTLSEWGLILLSCLFVMLAMYQLRQRPLAKSHRQGI